MKNFFYILLFLIFFLCIFSCENKKENTSYTNEVSIIEKESIFNNLLLDILPNAYDYDGVYSITERQSSGMFDSINIKVSNENFYIIYRPDYWNNNLEVFIPYDVKINSYNNKIMLGELIGESFSLLSEIYIEEPQHIIDMEDNKKYVSYGYNKGIFLVVYLENDIITEIFYCRAM